MILFVLGAKDSGKTHLVSALRRNMFDIVSYDDVSPTELDEQEQAILRSAGNGSLVIVCTATQYKLTDYAKTLHRWGELVQIQVVTATRFIPGWD